MKSLTIIISAQIPDPIADEDCNGCIASALAIAVQRELDRQMCSHSRMIHGAIALQDMTINYEIREGLPQ